MRYLILSVLFLLIAACHGCGPRVPVEAAQRLVPNHGFHLIAQTGGELQIYPHALYYSGSGHASVALAYRGQPVHVLDFAPGAQQFRLIAVDPDGGKVRLLATTCVEAHARGHLTWIGCETPDPTKGAQPAAQIIVEYDPASATTTKPGDCGSCPADSSGACCCPDVVTGLRCPSTQ